jgi:hypothetical protein
VVEAFYFLLFTFLVERKGPWLLASAPLLYLCLWVSLLRESFVFISYACICQKKVDVIVF